MVKKTIQILFGIFFFYTVCSCHSEQDVLSEQQGRFSLRLQTDTSFRSVLSRASDGFNPENTAAYKIDILRDDKVEQSFESYEKMPSEVTLGIGNYVLRASLGELYAAAFEMPYFEGRTDFTILENKSTPLSVTCGLANTKVKVGYTDVFKSVFEEYSVRMSTAHTTEPLVFEKDESRAAYFKANKAGEALHLEMTLKRPGKEAFTFAPPTVTIKPKEFVQFRFKTDPVSTDGGLRVEITIDKTTIDTVLNLDIPAWMLPVEAPVVNASGFTSGTALEMTEGVGQQASAYITAKGTIKNCILDIHSDYLTATRGLKSSYDLATISEADATVLKGIGLTWDAGMQYKKNATVDFSGLTEALEANAAGQYHEISLTVKDSVKITQQNEPLIFKVSVKPPVFAVSMTPGDAWAKKATLRAAVTEGDVKRITGFQVNQGGVWKDVAGGATVTGDEAVGALTGLSANTAYEVRAVYGKHYSAGYAFTTEQELQVPNAGMEEWNAYFLGTKYHNVPFYETWKSGETNKWWANNNDCTTRYRTSGVFGTTYGYNCFPSVSYTNDAHSGNRAAEIRTTGAGDASCNSGNAPENRRYRGMLFIGDYSWSDGDVIKYGRNFVSRPSSLEFYYKYKPCSEDEFEGYVEVQNRSGETVTVIGSGSFKCRTGQEVTAYTKGIAVINYTVPALKATHIVIRFHSTTDAKPRIFDSKQGIDLVDGDSGWSVHMGSVLKIDDINLVY